MSAPGPDLDARAQQLDQLLANASVMLLEFAEVTGLPGHDLRADAAGAMPRVQAFLAGIMTADATDDARIWLMNRLALFLGDWFMQRHGGAWRVETRPGARFLGHFVIGDMRTPVHPDAVLDPFAIAYECVMRGAVLQILVEEAEQGLRFSAA